MYFKKEYFLIPKFPFFVGIATIGKCNLKCRHCAYECGPEVEETLPRGVVFNLLRYLAEKGVKEVHFSGGEPLLDPNIYDYIMYAYDLNLNTLLITNGLLLTREVLDKLLKTGLGAIAVSVDGAQYNHEFLRGPGTFTKVLRTLSILKDYDFKKKIIYMVIHRQNINDIDYIISLVEEYNFTKLQLIPLIPQGRGKDLTNLVFSSSEFRQLLLNLKHKAERQKLGISLSTPLICLLGIAEGPCPAGVVTLTIHFNGDIYPYSVLLLPLGNIIRDGIEVLEYIWRKSTILNELRDVTFLWNAKIVGIYTFVEVDAEH